MVQGVAVWDWGALKEEREEGGGRVEEEKF